jgi:hypothetical protein
MRDVAMDSARRAVEESLQFQRIIRMRRAYMQANWAAIGTALLVLAFFATGASSALTSSILFFGVAMGLFIRFVFQFWRMRVLPN